MEKAASLLGVHRGSLSQAFSTSYGITASHYITTCRIRWAADLLVKSQLSIKEIAADSGFNSHEYFSRVFLTQTGYTPGAFRRQKVNIIVQDTDNITDSALPFQAVSGTRNHDGIHVPHNKKKAVSR